MNDFGGVDRERLVPLLVFLRDQLEHGGELGRASSRVVMSAWQPGIAWISATQPSGWLRYNTTL
jgi:hypothetical protein